MRSIALVATALCKLVLTARALRSLGDLSERWKWLKDGEFYEHFGMAKAVFPGCEEWKKKKLLKKAKLF